MAKLIFADRISTLIANPQPGVDRSPVSTPLDAIGYSYCPFTGTSVNLYALAFAAAQLTVARAAQHAAKLRYVASCN